VNEVQQKEYQELVKEYSPNSAVFVNCVKAFVVGGIICVIGQLIVNYFIGIGMTKEAAVTYNSIILIFAAILLTGLGWYSKLGKFAGAGSIVPITGFANAVAAPAIEHKREGLIMGVGAKMFVVAGPVIVYGTVASVVVGTIYYFMR
jgi:stage V sporulation protein AC